MFKQQYSYQLLMMHYSIDKTFAIIKQPPLMYKCPTEYCELYQSRMHVTLSHLRSKEITGIHKPCIPHSNDSSATTEYKPVCIQM